VYAALILLNVNAVCFSYFCGTIKDHEEYARTIINNMGMIWMLGTGVYANLKAAYFVKFISWISPMRYGTEVLFRSFCSGITDNTLRQ